MAWKVLEEGHGFGYVEYWHPEDIAHPEYPGEIPEEHIDYMDAESQVVSAWQDANYIYVIHHVLDETFNYFRYEEILTDGTEGICECRYECAVSLLKQVEKWKKEVGL